MTHNGKSAPVYTRAAHGSRPMIAFHVTHARFIKDGGHNTWGQFIISEKLQSNKNVPIACNTGHQIEVMNLLRKRRVFFVLLF